MTYSGRYFEISDIIDEYDPFAVACISRIVDGQTFNEYLDRDECSGYVFTDTGLYTIRLYDRNNNVSRFNVNIVSERHYSLSTVGNDVNLVLAGSGIRIDSVLLNGEEIEDLTSGGQLTLKAADVERTYVVYTVNTVTGETDCARITLDAVKEENTDTDVSGDNDCTDGGENLGEDSKKLELGNAILICSVVVIVAAGVCAVVLTLIWRGNGSSLNDNKSNEKLKEDELDEEKEDGDE